MSPDTSQPQTDDETVERMAEIIWDGRRNPTFGQPWSVLVKCHAVQADECRATARAALAVARPLIAADVQQRIAVALDQRKGDPRYGAALFVQRLDLNLSEPSR